MSEEELAEIEEQFRNTRAAGERFGGLPSWWDFYAGENLLAEVRRLRARVAELEATDAPTVVEGDAIAVCGEDPKP